MRSIPLLDRRRAAALFGDDTGAATAEYAITTMATVGKKEQIWRSTVSRQSELIAVRVLREQEWTYDAWRQRLSYVAIARRSALPESEGGLGYALSEYTVKQRLDGYRERMRPLLEANAVTARERQIAELDELSRLAQAALAKAAAGGQIDKDAARLLLDIHTREAKLLGLDFPTTVVAEIVSRDKLDSEVEALLARLDAE